MQVVCWFNSGAFRSFIMAKWLWNWSSVDSLFVEAAGLIPVCASVFPFELARARQADPSPWLHRLPARREERRVRWLLEDSYRDSLGNGCTCDVHQFAHKKGSDRWLVIMAKLQWFQMKCKWSAVSIPAHFILLSDRLFLNASSTLCKSTSQKSSPPEML